jgi:hypothetical protein
METAIINTPMLNLETRVENRQRLTAMKKEIEKQLEDENNAIKNEMVALGLDELQVGEHKLVLSTRDGRSTLDKTELMSLGVSAEQIQKATKTGDPYLQLDVKKAK